MRFTRYGEPSDAEIDARRIPPYCQCGNPVEDYDDVCEECLDAQDGKEAEFEKATSQLFNQ
jgi:hypothetical protein